MNNTSLLASFATLKELSDIKRYSNSYQILAEFISYIIESQKLYAFSSVEMKNYLNNVFGFEVPEAVVKTSCKSLDYLTKKNGVYSVDRTKLQFDKSFEKAKSEAEKTKISIVGALTEYIMDKDPYAEVNEAALTKALIAFLVDDQQNGFSRYTNSISEFILKNENNKDIQIALRAIQEGSILYIGLNHNINETGSITKKLTLFLGTEILFSLVGYNGEIYKQLAKDFFEQIRNANLNGEKIKLCYFAETKEEIESFFGSAELIVEGKVQVFETVAMKAIVNRCKTASDVAVKKSDFYYQLQYSYGIMEDDRKDYYSPENNVYNLESLEYEDSQDQESWKFVSHINKLRKGKVFGNNLDAEYLYITNTKNTLKVSKTQSEKIKLENGLDRMGDYAVSVNKITNILWFKLGNGFGRKNYPNNVNAVLRARVVLASTISYNVTEVYNSTKEQFKRGEITQDQLVARVITLHRKPILPEELEGDSIDESMDFSPEFISRYEEEVKANKLALESKSKEIENLKEEKARQLEEKDIVIAEKNKLIIQSNKEQEQRIKKIEEQTTHQLQERDKAIAERERIIQQNEEEKAALSSKLEEYQNKEQVAASKKKLRKNIFLFVLSIVWKAFLIAVIPFIGIYIEKKTNSNLPLYVCSAVDIIGLIVAIWHAVKKDYTRYFPKKK